MIRPMVWQEDRLLMLDQRLLPTREEWIELRTSNAVAKAIKDMVVRGAPAIGIAAAYGMALAALNQEDPNQAQKTLAESRPTAVNLFWALNRIERLSQRDFQTILQEARRIEEEDLAMNRKIGEYGARLIPVNANVLTICNTGALATAGHGTALGIIRSAHEQGKNIHVWSCETRPRQQGLRLTAYELQKEEIPFHSIADSVAASLMAAGKVDHVVAGADRIAANGDSANKIGTYSLAVLANYHGIPFTIAAPSSTIDASIATGAEIPIEERSPTELTHAENVQISPEGCPVFNPAFDVTPATLITRIVTEQGIHEAPYSFHRDYAA